MIDMEQLTYETTLHCQQRQEKQVTRGHNTVADGWAGAANPHPLSTPHPNHFPTQTHTQKASKTLLFPLFDSC